MTPEAKEARKKKSQKNSHALSWLGELKIKA
jgi:hypothetical protein